MKLKGYESVFQIKQNHSLYPKAFVDEMLRDAPGGVPVFLSGTLDGVNLIATGYRYSRKTILYFIMSEGAGSTSLGQPYEMKYTDNHGNICVRFVDRPDFISRYFSNSNTVDTHNHVRQSELMLEKKWLTKDPYFRLTTTLIGMSVTDAWRLAYYHSVIDKKRASNGYSDTHRTGIKRFAGIVASQLIHCSSSLIPYDDDIPPARMIPLPVEGGSVPLSDMTNSSSSNPSLRTYIDVNGHPHNLCKHLKNDVHGSKKYTKTRKCRLCWEKGIRHEVGYYCLECGPDHSYCSNEERDCFAKHVKKVTRISKRMRASFH